MTSNSANMTVADRLAQRLKESDMGSLMDEDSVIEIAREAIRKAFFEERIVRDGYSDRRVEPLAVSTARTTFEAAMKEAIKPVVDELIANDDFKIMIRRAVIDSIPEAAKQIGYGLVAQSVDSSTQIIMQRLQATVGTRLGLTL